MVIRPKQKQAQISFGYCDTANGQRIYPPPPEPTMNDPTDNLLPEQLPPAQSEPSNPHKVDDRYTTVTCWPPLGQAFVVPQEHDGVDFTVLLETSAPQQGNSPRICIWHNHNGHHDWSELSLDPIPARDDVLLLNGPQGHTLIRQWYAGRLSGIPKHGQTVSFTVKFLLSNEQGWRWIKETSGISDGELNYRNTDWKKHSTYEFNHWFSGLSSDFKVSTEQPDTDDILLFSLTAPVSPAKGQDSGWQHHQLGTANSSSRWFSLVRLWSPWLAPRQGSGKFEVDKDAILISFLRSDALHVVVLAISGVDDVLTTFFNDNDGNVIVKARNDRTEAGTSRLLVAVADSFEVANAAVFYHARKIVQSYETEVDAEMNSLVTSVQPKDNQSPEWLEEWYDGLTYCTWNGLGQKLTAEKIYNALDDLAKENINITNLIIDDNWQDLSKGETQFNRGWSSFEANAEGFPDGLKSTTSEIRRRHPNVRHIAVWHAILGYWGGIDPEGWIAKNYKTIEVEKEPGVAGGLFCVVAAEDAQRMYNDFYQFLSQSGVDAVKTDAQFFLDLLLHAPDRRALITTYQDAWTIAHLRYLGSRAISCMSQSPQIIFHSQLPHNKPRLLVRNSDDFFPEVAASHPWHIFCNAHNSLLTQHLNALPDFDMFQTSHQWAGFHAAARCVSGGPIYFTDYPGQHDVKLIRQMTAQTPNKRTVILRPQIVGKSINAYNSYTDLAILKIGTYVGFAGTGSGILGLFNVSRQHLSEFVSLRDMPGTEHGEYVVGSFTSRMLSVPMSRSQPHAAIVKVNLEIQGWDILTAYALKTFALRSSKTPVKAAMMGLVDKMTGSAGVTGYDIYVEENGRLRVWVSLKALGVLGIYISDLADRVIEQDFMVTIYGKPITVDAVARSKTSKQVLEIDVEKAWRESGEDAGWSNEVSVEIFMG